MQKPSVDLNIPNPVPLATAQDVADFRAKTTFAGQKYVFVGQINGSDIDGKSNIYIFIYKKGAEVPTDQEILETVQKGVAYENDLKENRIPPELHLMVKPEDIINKVMAAPAGGTQPDIYLPNGQLSGFYKRAELEEIKKLMRQIRYGADEYVTVYVSSSFDNVPAPLIRISLPPLYFMYEQALNEAIKYFGSSDIMFSKYYFLGMDGEFFEFTDGAKKALFDPRSNKLYVDQEVGTLFEHLRSPSVGNVARNSAMIDAIRNNIKQYWQQLLGQIDEAKKIR